MNTRTFSGALVLGLVSLVAVAMTQTAHSDSEKPVKHLDLPDVTTLAEAKKTFNEATSELQTKTNLNAAELNEIHIITYSLERALAYFVDNSDGDSKKAAEKMAVVIEEVHLASENNRVEETRSSLDEYFGLAERFAETL